MSLRTVTPSDMKNGGWRIIQNVRIIFNVSNFFLIFLFQTALVSCSKHLKRENINKGRLTFIRKFIVNMDTLLNTAQALASGSREACDTMDVEDLLKFPEEISICAESAARQYRNFIESEYETVAQNVAMGELEYFEKKAQDVRATSEELKRMLKASVLDPLR